MKKPSRLRSALRLGLRLSLGLGLVLFAAVLGREAPLAVSVRRYVWPHPGTPRYLVNLPPSQVRAPLAEPDVSRWVAAHRAVASGEQLVEVTLQGMGTEAVVLHNLHVRVTASGAALPWNDYAMGPRGVGRGGPLSPCRFDVGLDAVRAVAAPKGGQPGFPLKVDVANPAVLLVTARATERDVSWVLELEWSSGDRRGRLRIDDQGKPFRASGSSGRPAYTFALDTGTWIELTEEEAEGRR